MALVDMLLGEYSDKKGKMTNLQYAVGFDEKYIHGNSADDLRAHLSDVSKYLGSREFFVGSQLTVADFCLFEYLNQAFDYSTRAGGVNYRQEFPTLDAFCNRISSIPSIGAYLASEKFAFVNAYNNQHAKFR